MDYIKIKHHFSLHPYLYSKKRYCILIEHIQVCETQNDIIKFLNLINVEHNIHLKYGEILEKD